MYSSEFEIISKTEHKDGMAIQLQNQQSGKVLGQITLNLTMDEAVSYKFKPGDKTNVSVG